jgi:YD repeat-containing protein
MDVNRQNTLNFTYDALGRMLSAGDQFAGYAYAYDRLGRMISSDAAIAGLAPTVTLSNAYDAAGRRTQVAATMGGNADFVTDYAYDQLGRTTSIRQYALHVDADLRDAIPPASEMPGHVGSRASEMPDHVHILPAAEKRVDFTYDLASQPVTFTRCSQHRPPTVHHFGPWFRPEPLPSPSGFSACRLTKEPGPPSPIADAIPEMSARRENPMAPTANRTLKAVAPSSPATAPVNPKPKASTPATAAKRSRLCAANLHPSVPGDQSHVLTTGSHVVDGAHVTGSAACR